MLKPRDLAMALAVPLIWGMGVVFAKAAIEHFPPILLMAFRFSLTALLLVWFVEPPIRYFKQIFLIALISAAVQYSFTFNGLVGLDASTAALMIQLEVPFLVILAAIFLKERPGWRKTLGIVIAFSGAVIIYGEPNLEGQEFYLVLVILGGLSWAIGQVMVRHLGVLDGKTMLAWVSVFAAPQLFLFSYLIEDDQLAYIASAGWIVWGTVAYLGIVMTAIGYGFWYSLVLRHPINRVGPFLLLLPVFSVLGGVLLLDEEIEFQVLSGGAIIILGVASILTERQST